MSFEDAASSRTSLRYKDEDTSPTTEQELKGWYSYAIAAEVFAVLGAGLFLPVTMEQLARERGTLFSERIKPCVSPPHAPESPKLFRRVDDGGDEQCIVNFLGTNITTSSFAMYTLSAAVLTQAVVLICFSSFADHGPYRKKMLVTFAFTGSVACILFIFITPSVFFLAPLLVIVGVTSLGFSNSLLNAFLPLLVSHQEEHIGSTKDDALDYELESLHHGSHTSGRSHFEKLAGDLSRSSKISAKGVYLGYAAAVLCEIFSIGLLVLASKTSISKLSATFPMRFILFLVGVWWAIFTIPTMLWLHPRPGPPLPSQNRGGTGNRGGNLLFYPLFSLRSFWGTLRKALRLRQVVVFLGAWFLLSDAVATISGTAVLFARTELHMGTIAVVLLSITSIASGMIGAFFLPLIAKKYSLSPKTVLIACVAAMELIPLYGLLGFVPFIKNLGFGGLQRAWEIYPVGVLHGLVMGGISSYARSVFAPLIPEGNEAAFFALYAVTDKGSSAVGPALVGIIVDRAGTIRPAFIFLALLVLLPGPLLWFLDVEKGRDDATIMEEQARDYVRISGEGED